MPLYLATMIGLAFSVAVSALATINPFTEEDRHSNVDYSVIANSAVFTLGDTITVSWTASEGHSAADYIRLSRVGSGNQEFFWQQTMGPATSGTENVSAPNVIDRYELRLLVESIILWSVRASRLS